MSTDDAEPLDDAATDGSVDERYTRYQNTLYRLISMGAAGLTAVMGITVIVIGRTLDPIPPAQFFFVAGILAIVLSGWNLLGLRCRLDVADTWVHVATKYVDFRIDRDQIDWIDADLSMRGALQLSGRPLLIGYRTDDGTKTRTRRAYGCLPNDKRTQLQVVEALQDQLGSPQDIEGVHLDQALADRLAGVETEGVSSELSDAVAARLSTMEPEGDDPKR